MDNPRTRTPARRPADQIWVARPEYSKGVAGVVRDTRTPFEYSGRATPPSRFDKRDACRYELEALAALIAVLAPVTVAALAAISSGLVVGSIAAIV